MFGLTIFGDGATILRTPFINILAAGVHNDAGLLDIPDCTGHVAKGFKKDAEYISLEEGWEPSLWVLCSRYC